MAALIEAALDLGAVGFVLLCIAFLIAVKAVIVPLIDVLNVEIAGVHIWGGVLTKARNAVIRGCNAGIADGQQLVGDLLHGLAWAIRWQINQLLSFVHGVAGAFDLLWRHGIKGIANSVVAGVQHAETLLAAKVTALTKTVASDVASLKATIASTAASTLAKAEKYTASEVTKAENALRAELVADTRTLSTAIGDLQKLLTTDITSLAGTIGSQITAAEAYADAAAAAAARAVEGEVAADIAGIDALITSTVAGIEAQINAIPIPSLADIAATVAALSLVLTTVLAESGLDNPTCRSKVKGICGTDLNAFLALLGGLVAFGGIPSLKDIIDTGVQAVDYFAGDIESFVNAA